jgi:hypothetical protein
MKKFRISYRMEIFIDAETEQEAQDIFENNIDVYDLLNEPNALFVEQDEIEEV